MYDDAQEKLNSLDFKKEKLSSSTVLTFDPDQRAFRLLKQALDDAIQLRQSHIIDILSGANNNTIETHLMIEEFSKTARSYALIQEKIFK